MAAVSLAGSGCMVQDTEYFEGVGKSVLELHSTFTFEENSLDLGSKEHCLLPAPHGANLEGQQVRIELSGSDTGLCTVQGNSSTSNAQMNSDGLTDRLGWGGTGTISNVTVRDTYCGSGQTGCVGVGEPVTDFDDIHSISVAGPVINELIFTHQDNRVAYMAPHGVLEQETAEQVEAIYDDDVTNHNAYWAVGYKRAGGGGSNFSHYHITATDMSEVSFPGLDTLVGMDLDYAVTFHGCDASCPSTDVNVGGLIEPLFRKGVAELISEKLPGLVVTHNPPSGVDGDEEENVVNRVAAGHRGLQLEQSHDARDDYDVIAAQVKEVFDCLTDDWDNLSSTYITDPQDPIDYAFGMPSTNYTSGACVGYIGDFQPTNVTGTEDIELSGEVSGAVSCSSKIRMHTDVYRLRSDDTWERLGGGWSTRQMTGGQCTTTRDGDYEPAIFDDTAGSTRSYRVVVRATNTSGQAQLVRVRVKTL